MFHSFTGCDTVSAFAGKTVSKDNSHSVLSVNTDTIDADNDAVTERFSVLLYDRTTKLGNITEGNIRA